MAFPTTSVLDSGVGGDSNPLGDDWLGPTFSGAAQLQRLSNQLCAAANFASSYWSTETFGADTEVYVTVTETADTTSMVMWRIASVGTTGIDGYELFFKDNDNTFEVYRNDNGSETQLGADFSQAVADGDSFGAEMIGDTITVYHKPAAGSWASLGTRTDGTYTAAGHIALWGQNVDVKFTNFGGGTVAGGAAAAPWVPTGSVLGLTLWQEAGLL